MTFKEAIIDYYERISALKKETDDVVIRMAKAVRDEVRKDRSSLNAWDDDTRKMIIQIQTLYNETWRNVK